MSRHSSPRPFQQLRAHNQPTTLLTLSQRGKAVRARFSSVNFLSTPGHVMLKLFSFWESKRLDDWIERYGDHLKLEKNVSPHTLRNYLSDLRQFAEYLGRRAKEHDEKTTAIEDVTVHLVRAYLASLAKQNKKSSIGRKLAALKGFYRYLVREKRVTQDPLALVSTPKQEKPLPQFLSVGHCFLLLGGI